MSRQALWTAILSLRGLQNSRSLVLPQRGDDRAAAWLNLIRLDAGAALNLPERTVVIVSDGSDEGRLYHNPQPGVYERVGKYSIVQEE